MVFVFLILVISLTASLDPVLATSTTNPWNNTSLQSRLRERLLGAYDKFDDPKGASPLLPIKIVIKNGYVDEVQSTLTINAILQVRWTDLRLAWNESQYDLKRLTLELDDVTLPEFYLIDNVSPLTDFSRENSQLTTTSRGALLWVLPSVRLSVFCAADFHEWPFDHNVCTMRFRSMHDLADGSRYHHRIHLQTENDTNHPADKLRVEGWYMEWRDVNMNREHYEDFDINKDATLRFTLQRVSGVLNFVYFVPVIVVTILCLSGFCVPPTSNMSVWVNCFNVCFLSTFTIYHGNRFPYLNSSGTPCIMLIYSSFMNLAFFAIFVNIIVLRLSQTPPKYGLPWLVKAILMGRLKNILFTANYAIQVSTTRVSSRDDVVPSAIHQHDEQEASTSSTAETEIELHEPKPNTVCTVCLNKQLNVAEWTLLAVTLHHAAFLLYSIIFVVLLLTYGVLYKFD